MNRMKQYICKIGALLLGVMTLLSTSLGQGAPAQAAPRAATVTVTLWAKSGTLSLPDGVTVPVWGYADTAGGAAQVPGPVIIANEGDTVAVTLNNTMSEATSLFFGGQAIPPDLTGAAAGGTATYTFVATNPGTYLYEAGPLPNAQHQTAMGLFGALIVRPLTAGQAYNSATTAYDDEAVVVLSEIDPVLNNHANPTNFDLRNYSPRYWLINGKAHPNTVAIASDAGRKVLLRYVNAGLQYHSMTVLGLNQTVVAKDGSLLPYPTSLTADTIAPGQTADTITTLPATAAPGSRFALYDSNFLNLRNTNAPGFGGLVTFITTVAGGPAPDTTGPTTSGVAVTAGNLSASVSDVATGNSNVTAAEYYVDTTTGASTAMNGAFGSPTVAANATIPSGLLTGNHLFYVRGQDAAGNWGPFSSVTYTAADIVGPTTSALVLASNPTNGTADVTLSATATDGTSTITAAEYTIDGGAAVAMNVNVPALIANVTAVIPAATVNALAQGAHVIAVRSQDAAGNWGALAEINLLVDKTGPTANSVIAAPNPNNGTLGISPSQAVVRVTATFVDTPVGVVAAASADASTVILAESMITTRIFMPVIMANIQPADVEAAAVPPGTTYVQKAEGFIDTVGANGTGFPLTPSDGLYDEAAEDAYVYIPLSTINQLSSGNHTIHLRGQDGAGNWGPTSPTILIIDKVAPTFTGITLVPNSFAAGSLAHVTLTVNGANDGTGSGVVGGEYWFGTTNPAPGGGTAFTGLSTTIPVGSLAVGTYTVRARIRDAAGNWSTGTNGIRSATLTVTPPPPPPFYFSTSGNSNPPGVTGPADDSDIYFWNGTGFSRVWDASANGVPNDGANVDALVRLSANQHYLSFAGNTNITGLGTVQDEDIVYFNAGAWSVQFDGTAFGLTAGNLDIDAFDYVGPTLYLSTSGNTNPPGAGGTADDADIYRWNGGSSYTRIFDASTAGLPGGANVDGLTMVDTTHFYLSFTSDVAITGLGTVQDEDVIYYNAGAWSIRVDGTGLGLTSGNLDLDAIDIP